MRPKAAVIAALIVIIAVGGITIGLSGGSAKSPAKVLATPAPAPSRPVPAPTPTPTPTPTPAAPKTSATHLPPITRTPGPNRPTEHIVPVVTAPPVRTQPAGCKLPAGPQTISGRAVIIDLPEKLPAPLIIDFHGGNQSAAQEHAYTGLGPAGADRGFVVVTPNGTNGLWNFPGTEPLPDDVLFTQQIAYTLAYAGCSNGAVYTAGISDGADMAIAAGCRVPAVRAIFAVAPSITPRGTCLRKSLVEVHGTADPVVPYTGSAGGSFTDTPSVAVQARLPFWTSGCTDKGTGVQPAVGTVVNDWSCPDGRTVSLYTVIDGGHTWPGAIGNEPAAGLGARGMERRQRGAHLFRAPLTTAATLAQ